MSPMTPAEREAAERRLQETRDEIQALVNSTAPVEEREALWDALLNEHFDLLRKLDADEATEQG
jgi:hypothetical protein